MIEKHKLDGWKHFMSSNRRQKIEFLTDPGKTAHIALCKLQHRRSAQSNNDRHTGLFTDVSGVFITATSSPPIINNVWQSVNDNFLKSRAHSF